MKKVKPEENTPETKATLNNPEPSQPQNEEVKNLNLKITDLTNDLQRTRADFENFRKQSENQRTQATLFGKQSAVNKFLPLLDDFVRAFEAYPEQLAPLAKNFDKTLASLSLEKINSEENVEFNPDLHEAVSVADDEGEIEVIAETLRPGYLYEGEVLRPAMVKVKHINRA